MYGAANVGIEPSLTALLHEAGGRIHIAGPGTWLGGMSKPLPSRYRTLNWSSYNAALRKRGSRLAGAGLFDPVQPPE